MKFAQAMNGDFLTLAVAHFAPRKINSHEGFWREFITSLPRIGSTHLLKILSETFFPTFAPRWDFLAEKATREESVEA